MKALVFSGGAAKGAYQVGALKHLLGELENKYDSIHGTSVGAINGAYLAMFSHGQEKECIDNLENLWKKLKTSDIYVDWINLPKPLNYLGYLTALWKPSLYNSKPLMKLIEKNFDNEKIKYSGKQLRISAVSLSTGEFRMFTEKYDDLVGAILASSSFPGAFCPIELEGQLWTDGGVREITPLKSAISTGADEIDIIVTSPRKEKSSFTNNPNLIKLGPRIIDIMSEEIAVNDLARAEEINNLIMSGQEVPNKRYIKFNIIRPAKKLVKSSLEFEQKFIRPMIDKGYEDAIKVMSKKAK